MAGNDMYAGMYSLTSADFGNGPGDDATAPKWSAAAAYVPVASSIVSVIATADAIDMLLILNLAGGRNQWTDPGPTVNGLATRIFNQAKYETQIRRWTVAGGATSPVADGITAALASRRAVIYTVDEPHHSVFNGTITKELQNWMGLLCKEIWPGCITVQRSASTNLSPAPTGGWTGVDYGWAAYSGPQNRSGRTAAQFWADEMAALDALDLGMFASNNWLDGGDGRSGIRGQGGGSTQWLCAAAELTERVDALFTLPLVADIPAYVDWQYVFPTWVPTTGTLAQWKAYQDSAAYIAANDYVLTKCAARATWNGWRTAKGAGQAPPPATVGIQHIGTVTAAATTLTPTTHQAGDLLVAAAWRVGDATIPSLPAGWTNITTGSSNAVPLRLAYRIATGAGTASGTWTNAQGLAISVYRGAHPTTPIGDNTVISAAGTAVIQYQDITFTITDGTSWVYAAAVHSTASDLAVAPTGMTNRGAVGQGTVHDTNGGLSTWADVNKTVNASGGYRTFSIELVADPAGVAPPVNDPPVLASIAAQTVEALQLLTFTASATDPEGDTVEYTVLAGSTAVPTGAAINATTGVFTWTPTRDQSGTYNIVVRATDITGTNPQVPFAEQVVTILVTDIPDDPGPDLPDDPGPTIISAYSGGLVSIT